MMRIASSRHRLGKEDVDLALDVVVHDELLVGETFVEVQDVEHVAVRKLHRHHVAGPTRRAGARLIRRAGRHGRRLAGKLRRGGNGEKEEQNEVEASVT